MIALGVKYYRPYIFRREFDLQTERQLLKWLQAKTSRKRIRSQRWFVAKIGYIAGKENKIIDFLSRMYCEPCEIITFDSENSGKCGTE